MFQGRHAFPPNTPRLLLRIMCAVILSTLVVSESFADTRSPELWYGAYRSELELKKAAYSFWLDRYQKTGCGFDQWTWSKTANSISGIPNTSAACGGGHVVGTWPITKVCPVGYIPDNVDSPTICLFPEGSVDPSKETGTPDDELSCTSKAAGNPINFAVGNKFQEEVDYVAPAPSPMHFVRYYNSRDGWWRHNYSTHLLIASDNIVLVEPDGRESYFALSGDLASAEQSELGTLSKSNDQWVYTSPRNEQLRFDAEGRLVRWMHASGEFQSITYDNNLKVHVSDSLGNSMVFTNKIVFAPNGGLQPLSLVAGTTTITYSYDSNNRLTQRTSVRNGQTDLRKFHYEDARNNALLTGITDERGVRYAKWSYDSQGRAISSEHAGGAEKVLVSYNADGSSTVTNALGKSTIYRFQAIQGIKRITAIEGQPSANCPNSNSSFTYDERGLLKTKTDNKGFVTTFDYNERGQEVSRTEAAGTPQARTITTTWHATFNLPMTVTESGRVITYTYDAQGRQLSQTSTAL